MDDCPPEIENEMSATDMPITAVDNYWWLLCVAKRPFARYEGMIFLINYIACIIAALPLPSSDKLAFSGSYATQDAYDDKD